MRLRALIAYALAAHIGALALALALAPPLSDEARTI